MVGVISRIIPDRGFGFITNRDLCHKGIFIHASRLPGVVFDETLRGSRVEFEVETTERGQAAVNVRLINAKPSKFVFEPVNSPAQFFN